MTYLSEVIPLDVSGRFYSVGPLFINSSVWLSSVVSFGLSEEGSSQYWRFVLFVPVIAMAWRLVFFVFIHKKETPRFLISKERENECVQALDMIYKKERVDSVLEVLKEEQRKIKTTKIKRNSDESPGQQHPDHAEGEKVKAMRIKRTFLGCVYFIISQLIGINAIVFYSYEVFKTSAQRDDGTTNELLLSTFITLFYALNIFAAFTAGQVYDHVGRKTPVMFGILADGVTLLIVSGLFFLGDPYTRWCFIFFFTYVIGNPSILSSHSSNWLELALISAWELEHGSL